MKTAGINESAIVERLTREAIRTAAGMPRVKRVNWSSINVDGDEFEIDYTDGKQLIASLHHLGSNVWVHSENYPGGTRTEVSIPRSIRKLGDGLIEYDYDSPEYEKAKDAYERGVTKWLKAVADELYYYG